MVQLNRRQFLYSGVAFSAAAAFGPHVWPMSSEDALRTNNAPQEVYTGPGIQPQFVEGCNFLSWREQGLRLGENVVRYRHSIR